jgi:hypothetical protein
MIDINMNMIFIIILLCFLSYLDLKYILIFLIGSYILYYNMDNSNNNGIKRNLIDKTNNDNTLDNILSKVSQFKNININDYKIGLKYWVKFYNNISHVANTDDYDKYQLYLNKSIDHFNYLYLVNNDINLKNIINDLEIHGFKLLKNISVNLNKNWTDNPNTTMKQIIFNEPLPHNISFNR